MHMEYLIMNGYGIIYFCASFELEPMFTRPCWHHIYGVKCTMIDWRDLNPGLWRSGYILIHYATAAASQLWKKYILYITYIGCI